MKKRPASPLPCLCHKTSLKGRTIQWLVYKLDQAKVYEREHVYFFKIVPYSGYHTQMNVTISINVSPQKEK